MPDRAMNAALAPVADKRIDALVGDRSTDALGDPAHGGPLRGSEVDVPASQAADEGELQQLLKPQATKVR